MTIYDIARNREWVRFVLLTCGGTIQGLAMAIFLFPHHIPSGGAAGLAILLNHGFHLPLGFSLWIVNFTFIALAIHWFGYLWTLRTLFSVTVASTTISLLDTLIKIPYIPLLISLSCGAALFGTGVGILIKNGASSGGMVIPALAIANYRRRQPGKTMFWLNLLIFILTALVIDIKIIGFAILCQWMSSKIIDVINS